MPTQTDRARILRFALNLFGRQKAGVPLRLPDTELCDAKRAIPKSPSFTFVFRRDENVARLKVAVNDSGAMSKRESASKIGSPRRRPAVAGGGRIEMVFQRLAGDVFHYQEGNTVLVDSDVEQLDDGRIGKLADDLGLAEELAVRGLDRNRSKRF